MGLATVTNRLVKGYAGTPGYTAPEIIKQRLYGQGVDIFSLGVMIYRMLSGSKPFRGKGKGDRELDSAVLAANPMLPAEFFSPAARDLLTGLLQKNPAFRLGANGGSL